MKTVSVFFFSDSKVRIVSVGFFFQASPKGLVTGTSFFVLFCCHLCYGTGTGVHFLVKNVDVDVMIGDEIQNSVCVFFFIVTYIPPIFQNIRDRFDFFAFLRNSLRVGDVDTPFSSDESNSNGNITKSLSRFLLRCRRL